MSENNKRNITGSYPGAGGGTNRPKRVNPTGSYQRKKRFPAEPVQEKPILWDEKMGAQEPVIEAEKVEEKPAAPKKNKARLNGAFWKEILNKYWKTLAFYSCVLVVSIALASWVCHIGNELLGLVRPDKEYTVQIAENSSTMTIAKELKKTGIIDHPYVFRLYCKLKKADGAFKFGEYTLNSRWDYNRLISSLKRSPSNKTAVSFVIEAGDTQADFVANLCDTLKYLEREELEDVLQNYDFSDYSFLKGLSKRNARLEGYLYPDTYEMYSGESALAVVQRILDRFQEKVLTEENRKKMDASGYSVDQLITLASVLQKEGGNAMAKEAGVYFNRLKDQAYPYLESSAAVAYVLPAGSAVTATEIKINDPYNTYRWAGLTPGPISNPGADAIAAVLTPEWSDYKYFAVQGDGATLFAVDYATHLKNLKVTGEGARGTGTIL